MERKIQLNTFSWTILHVAFFAQSLKGGRSAKNKKIWCEINTWVMKHALELFQVFCCMFFVWKMILYAYFVWRSRVCTLFWPIDEHSIACGNVRKLINAFDNSYFNQTKLWTNSQLVVFVPTEFKRQHSNSRSRTEWRQEQEGKDESVQKEQTYILTCSMISAIPKNVKHGYKQCNNDTLHD